MSACSAYLYLSPLVAHLV